jgi:hypothetical protein
MFARRARQLLPVVAVKRIAFVAIALAITTMPAHARLPRSFDMRPPGERTLFFQAVLHELGAHATVQFEDLETDPQSKVLIVLGPTSGLDGRALNRLIERGLSVLIASDQRFSDRLSEELGVRVIGGFRTGFRDDCYRQEFQDCPLLHGFQMPGFDPSRHPVAQLLPRDSQVATNKPSYLEWKNRPFNPIATIRTPGGGFELRLGNVKVDFPDQLLVGVTREYPTTHGRLLVLADHSLFIDMMMQPDNNNLEFAFGVVRWLTEDGKRTSVLMYDNGTLVRTFDVLLDRPPSPPFPSLESLLPLVSERLAAVERENVFNRIIQQSVAHPALMRGTALVFTLGLLAFAVFRFLNIRQRFDARPKAHTVRVAPEPRRRALIDDGNFSEAARELALGTFCDLGRSPAGNSAMPLCDVRGGWRERWSWRRRIGRLWAIANGKSGSVSEDGLCRLHWELLELRAAATAGVVQFATGS